MGHGSWTGWTGLQSPGHGDGEHAVLFPPQSVLAGVPLPPALNLALALQPEGGVGDDLARAAAQPLLDVLAVPLGAPHQPFGRHALDEREYEFLALVPAPIAEHGPDQGRIVTLGWVSHARLPSAWPLPVPRRPRLP